MKQKWKIKNLIWYLVLGETCFILSFGINDFIAEITRLPALGVLLTGASVGISFMLAFIATLPATQTQPETSSHRGFLRFRKLAVILLGIFILVGLLANISIYAYEYAFEYAFENHPCSQLDFTRRANGCIANIPTTYRVYDIAFSAGGDLFATRGAYQVQVWTYPEIKLLRAIEGDWRGSNKFALSPNGELLAVVTGLYQATVFETGAGNILQTFYLEDLELQDVAFAPNDSRVLILAYKGLFFGDIRSGAITPSPVQENVMALSPDGSLLASQFKGYYIRRFADGMEIATIKSPFYINDTASSYIWVSAFSADSQSLITVNANHDKDTHKHSSTIRFWNVADGSLAKVTVLKDFDLEMLAVSNNTAAFAGGGGYCSSYDLYENPCLYVWPSGIGFPPIPLFVPHRIESLAFSPSDNRLLIGADHKFYIWQVSDHVWGSWQTLLP